MRILLVNVDSVIPNLALEKLRIYYERQGDKVTLIKDETLLPFVDAYEQIYVSCVFDYNKHRCRKWRGLADIGGSGYSLKKHLPAVIEKIKPKINLGFATRGCIRNCYFCIVPEKEGKIHIVGDIYDLWDGKGKDIILLDNNTLAIPKHFFKISKQLKKENLKVDFNQGLDHRLLTNKICKELFSLKHFREIRFAFDHISYKKSVLKALTLLRKNGLKDWQTRWYIYVGIKDNIDTVLQRINILRNAKQLVYLMRDKAVQNNPEYARDLLVWCNYPGLYKSTPFCKRILDIQKNRRIIDNRPNLFEDKRSEQK